MPHRLLSLLLLALLAPGCDGGLAPPEEPPLGAIRGTITYRGAWPPPDSLHDLRFVALRFVPQDTADFLQLTRMVFSERLPTNVSEDAFFLDSVEVGPFLYSGVAQNFSANLLDWRPVGLYTGGDGTFDVRAGDTTDLDILVDFDDLPPFPPE